MKFKQLVIAGFAAFLAMGFTPKASVYKIDAKQSKLTWTGRKVSGEHTGGINIAKGTLLTAGDKITGGTFEIDLTSITNSDIENLEYNKMLVDHLKSDDFFAAEKHPKASFVISNIKPVGKTNYEVKGYLTIKGITKAIEFPAVILKKDNQLRASAKIMVDRTAFDIRYGSGSFFENLGDKAIDNEFELNVELIAIK